MNNDPKIVDVALLEKGQVKTWLTYPVTMGVEVVCKLLELFCFIFLGVAPIPCVKAAIVNLSRP